MYRIDRRLRARHEEQYDDDADTSCAAARRAALPHFATPNARCLLSRGYADIAAYTITSTKMPMITIQQCASHRASLMLLGSYRYQPQCRAGILLLTLVALTPPFYRAGRAITTCC